MKKTLQTLIVLLAAFLSLGSAQPAHAQLHDCRINSLAVVLSNPGDGLVHMRAVYRANDNMSLTNTSCPDQVPPTWGSDIGDPVFEDALGYRVTYDIAELGNTVHLFNITQVQGIDPQVQHTLDFCIYASGGVAHGIVCPAALKGRHARMGLRAASAAINRRYQ